MTPRIATWITNCGDVVRVRAARDGYRWNVRAANGEVVGSGEAHPRWEDAIAAAERHHPPVDDGGAADFMTVDEIAARLDVSRMTVYRLVHAKELAAIRVGRQFRVTRKAVAEFVRAASTVGGAA